jgi:DNA-binding CsgD family transcriptional regulator
LEVAECLKNVSSKYRDKIVSFCEPLETFLGINCFAYIKITNDDRFHIITSHLDWIEYYFERDLHTKQPHIVPLENSNSGLCLARNINDCGFKEIMNAGKSKFNVNCCLSLMNKTDDAINMAFFDVNSSDELHDTLLLNELPIIKKFLARFVSENQDIMDAFDHNSIDMGQLFPNGRPQASREVMRICSQRRQLLENLGIKVSCQLSMRESELLREIGKGFSATQISKALHLSRRTVEHAIERLKDKLDCSSKLELTHKAQDLELFGHLVGQQ